MAVSIDFFIHLIHFPEACWSILEVLSDEPVAKIRTVHVARRHEDGEQLPETNFPKCHALVVIRGSNRHWFTALTPHVHAESTVRQGRSTVVADSGKVG